MALPHDLQLHRRLPARHQHHPRHPRGLVGDRGARRLSRSARSRRPGRRGAALRAARDPHRWRGAGQSGPGVAGAVLIDAIAPGALDHRRAAGRSRRPSARHPDEQRRRIRGAGAGPARGRGSWAPWRSTCGWTPGSSWSNSTVAGGSRTPSWRGFFAEATAAPGGFPALDGRARTAGPQPGRRRAGQPGARPAAAGGPARRAPADAVASARDRGRRLRCGGGRIRPGDRARARGRSGSANLGSGASGRTAPDRLDLRDLRRAVPARPADARSAGWPTVTAAWYDDRPVFRRSGPWQSASSGRAGLVSIGTRPALRSDQGRCSCRHLRQRALGPCHALLDDPLAGSRTAAAWRRIAFEPGRTAVERIRVAAAGDRLRSTFHVGGRLWVQFFLFTGLELWDADGDVRLPRDADQHGRPLPRRCCTGLAGAEGRGALLAGAAITVVPDPRGLGSWTATADRS